MQPQQQSQPSNIEIRRIKAARERQMQHGIMGVMQLFGLSLCIGFYVMGYYLTNKHKSNNDECLLPSWLVIQMSGMVAPSGLLALALAIVASGVENEGGKRWNRLIIATGFTSAMSVIFLILNIGHITAVQEYFLAIVAHLYTAMVCLGQLSLCLLRLGLLCPYCYLTTADDQVEAIANA